MFDKLFIDTNILVDNFDSTRATHKESFMILDYCLKNSIKIYTSCDIVTTVYYLLSKSSDRFKALKAVDLIGDMVEIIPFSLKELKETTKLMKQNQNYKDFEDTLQYILAKNSSCDAIVSNNKNFFSQEVPLYTSKEFVKRFLS
jgi:predicted nucleic acid-binding protein